MNAADILALIGVVILPTLEAQVIVKVYSKKGYRPGAILSILHVGAGTATIGQYAKVSQHAGAPTTCPHVVTAIWIAMIGVILAAFGFMHLVLYSLDFIETMKGLGSVVAIKKGDNVDDEIKEKEVEG